jgi:hypothetical protein
MPRGLQITRAQAEAHQRRHGFCFQPEIVSPKEVAKVDALRKRGSRMNKTESEYAMILEAMKRKGEIIAYSFEAIKLRLADNCWYTPDFFVERIDQLPIFVEIKGSHVWDDSKVKFRTAREIHTWADFEMMQKTKSGWASNSVIDSSPLSG